MRGESPVLDSALVDLVLSVGISMYLGWLIATTGVSILLDRSYRVQQSDGRYATWVQNEQVRRTERRPLSRYLMESADKERRPLA